MPLWSDQMLTPALQEGPPLGSWKSKQIIRWLNRLTAQGVRRAWAAAAQAFLVIKYLCRQMRPPLSPGTALRQWWALLPGCAVISCPILSPIGLHLYDITFFV